MWNCNNPYRDRNETLQKLGFNTYKEYLKSDLWKSIKKRVMDAAGERCSRCSYRGTKRLQVHHRSYDLRTLVGTDLRSLTVLCRSCHCAIERPTDFTRTAYDRLWFANEAISSKIEVVEPHVFEKWYERNARWLPKCDTGEQIRALVAMYRGRATSVDGQRCLVCGRLGVGTAPRTKSIDGYHCCDEHLWGQVRAAVNSLRLGVPGQRIHLT